MANTIHVDVVSAEEHIFSGDAEFVVLPGEAGELGIYPRHTPLITRIKPGAHHASGIAPGRDPLERGRAVPPIAFEKDPGLGLIGLTGALPRDGK